MRLKKLLLHTLIICTLAMPAGLGEGEIPVETAPPTPVPATLVPATPVPVTPVPATPVPETPVPVTPVPETPVPVTQAPATEVPATEVPETQAPATEAPETQAPETQVPSVSPSIEPSASASAEPSQAPSASPSNEATLAPSEEPTVEPSIQPTEGSTAEPSTQPTEEPTADPSAQPTEEPTAEPSIQPTEEPTVEPTAEPSADPSLEPTLEPSPDPSVSPEPSATPLPLPGAVEGLVTITPEGGMLQASGVWSISLSRPESPLAFSWTVSGEAQNYLIYVQDALGNQNFIAEIGETRMELSSAAYSSGQFTFYVGAVLPDGGLTWGSAAFEVAARQGGFPGGMGGGFGGFRGYSSGFGGSMGGASGMPQEEQGFRVTPGEALTSKHSSGSKDTTAYTHSNVEASQEAVNVLELTSTQAQITLDDGARSFFTGLDGDKLQLIPASDGEEWQLSALAMNTLAASGIDRVEFHLGATSWSLPTQMQFGGSVYASLRAQGYVSKDMTIRISALGVQVHIAGGAYSINEGGELVPMEG